MAKASVFGAWSVEEGNEGISEARIKDAAAALCAVTHLSYQQYISRYRPTPCTRTRDLMSANESKDSGESRKGMHGELEGEQPRLPVSGKDISSTTWYFHLPQESSPLLLICEERREEAKSLAVREHKLKGRRTTGSLSTSSCSSAPIHRTPWMQPGSRNLSRAEDTASCFLSPSPDLPSQPRN